MSSREPSESDALVPVVIVTGFLGSGKTSLIAGQLDQSNGDGLAVIVHDLGEENIDVAYLQGGEHVSLASDHRIRAVSSGHITKSHIDQLADELDDLCSEQPPYRAVLVETSGAANVIPVVERLRAGGSHWGLVSVVTVLDASVLGDYSSDPMIAPLLERQALSASLLILNKWDRADSEQQGEAEKYLAPICMVSGAAVYCTEFGQIDAAELLSSRPIPENLSPPDLDKAHPVESVHLMQRRPFHPARLEHWLEQSWIGIVRVKGFLWLATDMDGIYVLDAAGSQREVGLEGTWYASVSEDELKDDPEVQRLVNAHPWGDRRQALTIIGSPDSIAAAKDELESALLTDHEMAEGPERWIGYDDPLTSQFT